MKEEKKIPLDSLRDNLQARMHYKNPDYALKVLLICFARKRKYFSGWAGSVKKKGWMSPYVARQFAEYCGYPIDRF